MLSFFTVARVPVSGRLIITAAVSFCLLQDAVVSAQAVSGIVTDYNTFWKSSASAINPVKPANSHNVLAFTFNGVQYSTGVNDALLSSHGEVFTPGDFWSLPVASLSGAPTSNTKVGLGQLYDGVHNGASNPAPSNDLITYLTDGIKGLNIGTCIANLPAGTMFFNVANIRPEHIGDGVPDILVTQVADPSSSTDRYSFVDANGAIIGTEKNISFNNIPPVANWTADFYEASANPLHLTSGFTNTDRPMRLWAADLSELGITVNNYQSIARFAIRLSGNSDVAFVAYNSRTINITNVLPVKLTSFTAISAAASAELAWETANEQQADHFIIERSENGIDYTAKGKVMAAGNSTVKRKYKFTDRQPANGVNHYRLKIVDHNGDVRYSQVVTVHHTAVSAALRIYPNPASGGQITITHTRSTGQEQLHIQNAAGMIIARKQATAAADRTSLSVAGLNPGVYYLVWISGSERQAAAFSIH